MRVAVTGASGLLGSHLVRSLRADGHDVLRLVRRPARRPDEVRWDPASNRVDKGPLSGVDAAIHLAGAGLGDRPWTPGYRRLVYDSRVNGTRTLASVLADLEPRPRVLLSMSGVGYYGNQGDRELDESSPLGTTYIAKIAADWEKATSAAAEAGIRVVTARTGVVVAAGGGAFGRILPLFRLGLGGRIGSGRQYWSWVGLRDYVRAMRFLLDHDDVAGPVNVCAPHPVTNAELTTALARLVHRPALLPVPALALKLAFRDFAEDLLGGQRVLPARLLAAGFTFDEPVLEDALRTAVSRDHARTTS